MTGVVAGAGIWSTHFIAMLAFATGLPTRYAALETLGSLVVAILSATFGFALASAPADADRRGPAARGGVIIGVGIALMHYTGMAGYRTTGHIHWDTGYVVLSVFIGAALATAALLVAPANGRLRDIIGAAGFLSLAIVGMHFAGMSAVTIIPDPTVEAPYALMSHSALVGAAVAVTGLILLVTIGGVILDAANRNRHLRRLREAIEVLPTGLAFYDAADRLETWNAAYEELLCLAEASLVAGRSFDEILADAMARGAFPGAVGREAEWASERMATRRDGSTSPPQQTAAGRWIQISNRRTENGGTVAVVVDITELKAAERAAEAARDAKAEFLANMSHELRTPLTSVVGFSRLLAEQPELSIETRRYVERVSDASQALLCTVNDILDFSKLEAGEVAIHREPVSISRLCQATLDLFTPQASAKDLRLVLDDGVGEHGAVLSVDPGRLRQILLNLVGNAVKFTAHGHIKLRVHYDASTERLVVEVIDTGPGLSPDDQQRLFKRFSQVDGSLTRSQGGAGLGLAICKGLVEAMGGEIGVESAVGLGSRFWFQIPARVAMPRSEASGEAVEHLSLADARILVVDDNASNRDLARLFLTAVGAEVTEAANGEQAVQAAAEAPYDVILMDIQMPVLDGPGAFGRIRGTPGPNDKTPILAFTADAEPDAREKFMAIGFGAVVSKPLTPEALISAVAAAAAYPSGSVTVSAAA